MKKGFFRWLIETQLIKEKSPVWKEIFMNIITMIMLIVFAVLLVKGVEISNEFMVLLSMIIGFYFTNNSTNNPPVINDVKPKSESESESEDTE